MISRPSWSLVITSSLLIGSSLFFGGVMLSCLGHWDPCFWVTGLICSALSFFVSYWQYAATYQANKSAAVELQWLFLLMSVGVFLLAGAAVLESVFSGGMPTSDIVKHFVLPLVLVGGCFGWISFVNFRWKRELNDKRIQARVIESSSTIPTFRLTVVQLLVLIGCISAVLAGVVFGVRDIPPQVAAHVSAQEARLSLPAGATDVCVRRGVRGTINYNFAIDEAGFWEWTKSVGGSLESESSGVRIMPVAGSFEIFDSFSQDGHQIIRHGWFYDFQVEDRGIHYAYDADEERAYFFYHGH